MKNNQKRKVAFIPLFLSLCILFLSIGYATTNSITGEIKGKLFAIKQDGVFITDVVYDSSINANQSNSKINNYVQTTLDSSITLSASNDSAITYKVTIYNSTDYDYQFNKVLYAKEFYDNSGITFKLTDLETDDKIISNGYLSFYITFSYVDDIVSENNILNSYLNFDFNKVNSDNSGLDLKYDVTNSWSNNGLYYYQVDFTLTNIGDLDYDDWNIDIPISSGYQYIGGWSNSNSIVFDSSDNYIFNVSSDYLLSSGDNVVFTIQIAISDSELKLDSTIDGSMTDEKNSDSNNVLTTEGIEVKLEKANSWSSGSHQYYYQYNLTVSNTTDSVINDWQVILSVPSGSRIDQVWNIDYVNDNNIITIKAPSGNNSLAANSSYTLGGFIIMLTEDNYELIIK